MKHLQLLTAAAALALTSLLAGCGLSSPGTTGAPGSPIVTGAAISGRVHGGQQPVSGATIQLYAAGSTGYASASIPLIAATISTDATGAFNITSTYTCPPGNSAQPVYLVATGGNPGLTAGTNNQALALMAALGPCSSLSASSFVFVNELTTIASAYALSGFATDLTHIGTSASNLQGLGNAFASVNKLVNTANGIASGPALPAGAILPIAELNTLGDILAPCINSAGGTGNGTACGSLFNSTTIAGSVPADTVVAALAIAHTPANNVASLFGLVQAAAPFQPTLTAAPNDWTIAVNYSGGGLSTPKGIAIDAAANVWIPNCGSPTCATPAAGSVSEFANSGTALSTSTGFTAGGINIPYALAPDLAGNIWVANSGNNSLTRLSTNGSTGVAFSGGGLNLPRSIAIDGTGNVFLANSGANSISEFTSAGIALSPTGYTGGGLTQPVAIIISPN